MTLKSKPVVVINFSSGRTSAMMTKWLLDNKSNEYEFVVVFVNTGHEREASLIFADQCDRKFGFNTVWLEGCFDGENRFKIVDFNSAYRNVRKNGIDPFEAMITKHGIMNRNFPHCSRELKSYTVKHFARSIGLKNNKYWTALGIRSDEPKRLNWERAKKEMIMYFAQFGNVTKSDINTFWASQTFDLDLKSYEGNCILCWKKSLRKLLTIVREGIINNDPELLAEMQWISSIQEKYGHYQPDTRNNDLSEPLRMFRDNMSIQDLIEQSEGFIDFAIDESKLIITAKQMSLWDSELDGNFGCVESCEAFVDG